MSDARLTPASELHELPEKSEFCNNVRRLCTVCACRVLGDDVTYTKFLQRQSVNGNAEAAILLSGVVMADKIKARLIEIETAFATQGHSRVAYVLDSVRNSSTPKTSRCNIWSVCSLTGKVGQDFLVLHGRDVHMLVHSRHRKFLHCYWMLTHMTEMEMSRVELFAQCDVVTSSIKSMIQRFLSSDQFVTEEQASLYYEAYVYVDAVFKASLQQGDVHKTKA